MKIRKIIAATLIAGTALMGTATAASAGISGNSLNTAEIEFVEVGGGTTENRGNAIFTDGFESGNSSAYGGSRATYLKYELVNVQVTAFDVNASGN